MTRPRRHGRGTTAVSGSARNRRCGGRRTAGPVGRVGRLPDEVAPFVAGGRCQWILLAFGGARRSGLADVDQPRAAGLRTRLGAEQAFGHRQLIHGQLGVLLGVVLADRCLAGFDVDDHQPPGPVAFQPVDPAAQPDLAAVIARCRRAPRRRRPRRRPRCSSPRVCARHCDECLDHGAVPGQLVGRMPLSVERQVLPGTFQLGHQLRFAFARFGDQRVQHRAEMRPQLTRVGSAVPFDQPAQRAVVEGLQCRRRQRDRIVAAAERIAGADRDQAVPAAPGRRPAHRRWPTGPIALPHNGERRRRRHRREHTRHRATGRPAPPPTALAGLRPAAPHFEIGIDRRPTGRSRRRTATAVRRPWSAPPVSLSTAVTSNRRRARPIAATSSLRSSASSGARTEASSVTPSSTSSSRWVASTPPRGIGVGPQPVLQAGDDHHIPFMSERGVCAEHPDLFCRRGRFGLDARQLQRRDVLDESAQRRAGRARHVLIGDVEQRGHRLQVPGGLGAGGAAALAGRQPAALQAGPMPRRPQRVARILAAAMAARGRVQDRAHPLQRARLRGGRGAPPGQRRRPPGRRNLPATSAGLARSSVRRSCRSETGSTRPIGPVSNASA